MTTNQAERVEISEIIDGPRSTPNGPRRVPVDLRYPDRRTRWTATAVGVLVAVAAVATAIVLAVSAAIVGLIIVVVGFVLRVVTSISGKKDRH